MRKEKQKLPVWATTGHLKEGTRAVWHCKVLGCPFVSIGEHEIYRGESTRNEIEYAEAKGKPICYLEAAPADQTKASGGQG